MNNLQFREYLQKKLDDLRKLRNTPACPENYGQQESLLTSALKIMTYSPGPVRRRFRRDFERRLGLKRELDELKNLSRLSKGLVNMSEDE